MLKKKGGGVIPVQETQANYIFVRFGIDLYPDCGFPVLKIPQNVYIMSLPVPCMKQSLKSAHVVQRKYKEYGTEILS